MSREFKEDDEQPLTLMGPGYTEEITVNALQTTTWRDNIRFYIPNWIDTLTGMPESKEGHAREDLDRQIKKLVEMMLTLGGEMFGAATFWRLMSDIITDKPEALVGLSPEFFGYSLATGAAAGVGAMLAMFLCLGIKKSILKSPEGERQPLILNAEKDYRVFTKKNWVHGLQLVVGMFSMTHLWAPMLRVGKLAPLPLSASGPIFLLKSKSLHKLTVKFRLASEENSNNPELKNVGLMLGISIAAVSLVLHQLMPPIFQISKSSDPLPLIMVAALLDSLVFGTLAGVGANLAYFLPILLLIAVKPKKQQNVNEEVEQKTSFHAWFGNLWKSRNTIQESEDLSENQAYTRTL